MAHSFKNYPAKPAFGANKQSNEAGDYILKKKARATYCTSSRCPPIYNLNSQGDFNLLRTAKYIDRSNNQLPFNKNNLNINLVTKLDLNEVCVIADASNNQCSTNIEYSKISDFYNYYIICICICSIFVT